MERNVTSWGVAINAGHEPRLYPFNPEGIPAGEYTALLDFKIWAKKAMAVVCYFRLQDIQKKCSLSVFRLYENKEYMLKGGDIDFTTSPINILYKIVIDYKVKGKPVLKGAKLVLRYIYLTSDHL